MKRLPLLAALLALCCGVSCAPQTLTLYVDMRHPSATGVDLSRRNVSVVSMMDPVPGDTLFGMALSRGFARGLEDDWYGGSENIALYRVPKDTVTLEKMHQLVMDTGDDLVFLFEPFSLGAPQLGNRVAVAQAQTPDSAFVTPAHLPWTYRLHVYDSMGAEDRFHTYIGNGTLRGQVYDNGLTPGEWMQDRAVQAFRQPAERVGARLSEQFASTWQVENFTFYYFEDFLDDRWMDAAGYAMDMEWGKAARLWLQLVESDNAQYNACASYNLALAFYMMGDSALALRWLDQADAAYPLTLSPGLRKKILS